jgi:hypothetical protein
MAAPLFHPAVPVDRLGTQDALKWRFPSSAQESVARKGVIRRRNEVAVTRDPRQFADEKRRDHDDDLVVPDLG